MVNWDDKSKNRIFEWYKTFDLTADKSNSKGEMIMFLVKGEAAYLRVWSDNAVRTPGLTVGEKSKLEEEVSEDIRKSLLMGLLALNESNKDMVETMLPYNLQQLNESTPASVDYEDARLTGKLGQSSDDDSDDSEPEYADLALRPGEHPFVSSSLQFVSGSKS